MTPKCWNLQKTIYNTLFPIFPHRNTDSGSSSALKMKLISRKVPKDFEDEQVSLLPEDPEDMVSPPLF